MRRKLQITTLILALAALLAACTNAQTAGVEPTVVPPTVEEPAGENTAVPTASPMPEATATTDPSAAEALLAPVESIEVGVERTEIAVVARGNLRDGCTEIDEIETTQEGDTLRATITVWRDLVALCTEAPVPFEEIIRFDRAGLTPGPYTVIVNGVSHEITLLGEDASIAVELDGRQATVSGSDLPPNQTVELAVAPPNTEYAPFTSTDTDATGAFELILPLSEDLPPGEQMVVVANVDGQELFSAPFVVPGRDVSGIGSTIYLVALGDGGELGEEIGCGDSLVPVQVDLPAGTDSLTASIEKLLTVVGETYGDPPLYNALNQSDLTLVAATMTDETISIELEGELMLGGVCDEPRVQAQLVQTALGYAVVDNVEITINGEPLADVLGGGDAGLPPEAVLDAQAWLAEQLDVPVAEVVISGTEQVEWSDSCLGLGGPAESCAAVITPGWRALFTVDGQTYEVRTDETGEAFRSPQFN